MSLSLKLQSIFSIIISLGMMQYEFENGAVLEVPEKLVIVASNPLICYLIIEVSYADPLLITKRIVLGIELKVSDKTSFISDSTAKLARKTRPDQRIPRQPKN